MTQCTCVFLMQDDRVYENGSPETNSTQIKPINRTTTRKEQKSQSLSGRYRLQDFGNGTFTVNITDLQESDSGIYWCGVKRAVTDTYNTIRLTVSKDSSESITISTQPYKETQTSLDSHTTTPAAHSGSASTTASQTSRDSSPDALKRSTLVTGCATAMPVNRNNACKVEEVSDASDSASWASTNKKYFCRDPCGYGDIFVKSDQTPKGRYTLKDYGAGNFTVNITDLRESDSGIYWCGVERVGPDTFKKVILIVSKVPLYYIPYAAAGLVIMVILCAVGLVTVCQCRKRVKKSRGVIDRSIYNSHHSEEANAVYQNAPDDRPYATIKKSRTKSNDESQSDPIYQNLQFNTTQGEAIYGNL
ncbi:uncharacterized protein [Sinocyclocheilus grahami]|uniref:uncharacterized protein n=1 Tax=Sinocyclocheilus grahami TaxID=75366 RepID=UPI0007AD6A4C|nr:PREDICTED: uncharacterized protein LOC107572792 [Sinocyclocheilus grahami]